MSNRYVMGVDLPLNELIELSFTMEDAQLTPLDYNDALGKSGFSHAQLSLLRAVDLHNNPAELQRWMVSGKKEYVGAWTKRLSKYIKKKYGINLDPTPLSVLSEHLSKSLSAVKEKLWIEFTDHAEWKAGEFGDPGSCWWGSENKSRLGLIANGGGAIRLYTEDKAPRARLWYSPINGGDSAVIFNIKDAKGIFTMLGIARMLSMKYDISYMRAYELHFPSSYIDGEGSAYQVGRNLVQRPITLTFALPAIKPVSLSGFEFGAGLVQHTEPPKRKCEDCGNAIYEGDQYRVDFRGNPLCEECAEGYDYIVCEDCDKYVHTGEYIYMENLERAVCPDCYDGYGRCAYCDDYIAGDDGCWINDTLMCEGCRDEHYISCDDCGEYANKDDTYTVEGERNVCANCFEDYRECLRCTEYFEEGTEVLNNDEEEWWCKGCADAHAHMCDDCNCLIHGAHDCPEAPPEEEQHEEQP